MDNIIQERMQSAFSKMKSGKESDTEDNVEKKYEEAVTSLSEDKKQVVRGCSDAILTAGQKVRFSYTGWDFKTQSG